MKKEKPFYIGWQEDMPKEYKSTIKKFIILIFIALPILAFSIIYAQKGFNNHQFELGKSTELTGIYHSSPIPVLEVLKTEMKSDLSNYVMLVGYGKFGAEGIMENIEALKGDLNGRRVTLKGTMIYGDGKAILELTKKTNSLITIHEGVIAQKLESKLESSNFINVVGEIVDPKCYFGVMKPGEGKIHKSCAIRCISGGIPPVFKTKNSQGKNEYYILLGEKGEKINQQILDKIAEKVSVSGRKTYLNGWNYLYINPKIIKLLED
jgi:hypothetical protein